MLAFIGLFPAWIQKAFGAEKKPDKSTNSIKTIEMAETGNNIGVHSDGLSYVYIAKDGTPDENMASLLELSGGMDRFIQRNDIVVIKPNAQWWNQGMTNTDSLKAFIDRVLEIEHFSGEIIIAENHQYKDYDGRGWNTEKRNGRFNYNELVDYYQNKGNHNVTKYYWRGVGKNPEPLEGDDCCGAKLVKGPADGDGYVWDLDNVYVAPNGNRCIMTYPVFTSTYSGITIDLKNGAWKDGRYLEDRNVKFINFSALNHHGIYCGATASIKNLMGVVDMTCGYHAPDPEGYYNVHFVGVKKYVKFNHMFNLKKIGLGFFRKKIWENAYENFHFTGGALGYFMKNIRKPDLNIISAEWIGWGSRTDTQKSARTKTLLCSEDPVALDYLATKDVLLNATPKDQEHYYSLNNPDTEKGPLHKFLQECQKQGIGNLQVHKIKTITNQSV